LDPRLHNQLGELYAERKKWFAAIAQYRTGITLGNSDEKTLISLAHAYMAIRQVDLTTSVCKALLKMAENEKLIDEARSLLLEAQTVDPWPLTKFNSNQYCRIKALADHLHTLIPRTDSVLDVGGGEGQLALFTPNASYVLAEPNINGLSGTALPFLKKTFDACVSCHVLEHIPAAERSQFLEQLSSVARKYVVLQGPFFTPNTSFVEWQQRLQLVMDLTGAEWAEEHLALGLPELEEVVQFSAEHGFGCQIQPNGAGSTNLAMVFVNHYASLAGRSAELEMIYHIFNTHYYRKITHPEIPNDYIVTIDLTG